MAEPIKEIEFDPKNIEEEQSAAIHGIIEQIAENHEVIQDSLTIIRDLHESGFIDIVKGLLVTRVKVGAIAMEQISQPGMLNIVRNVMTGIEFLSSMEPTQLKQILDSAQKGLERAKDAANDKSTPGLWGTIKATKDPNVKMALNTMILFLEGMGKGLKDEHAAYHEGRG